LNHFLNWCRSWYVFLKCLLEKRRRLAACALPVGTYLELCRGGFFPNKKKLYQFKHYDPALYVTDQQMLMTAHIHGEQAVVLSDKVLFELAMGPFVHVPHNFAFVHKSRLISLDSEIKDLADVKALLIRDKLFRALWIYGRTCLSILLELLVYLFLINHYEKLSI
jgi:hypothetical protein